jgi:hypothetical protein
MRHVPSALAIVLAAAAIASAQPAEEPRTPSIGYPTVSAALDALRAQSGVKVLVQDGWTVIDDRATNSIWSFTPPAHPAHPAVIRRMIVQKDTDIFIRMSALCEAAKSECDKLIAQFTAMNEKMRDSMKKRAP